MTRRIRTHFGGSDSPTPPGLRPKHLTKKEFGRRVYTLMVKKGWHQSELARQAKLPNGESLSRDAISKYIRGATFPTPPHLKALAEALGVEEAALLPNTLETAIDEDDPAFEMKASTQNPGVAWLRVNRLVKTSTAVKIASLLEDDDALNSNGSGPTAPLQRVEDKAPAAKKTA
jgi:transcriptional regulator with XRE-family HTH domain